MSDYARIAWKLRHNHFRYKKYVEQNGFPCQDCGGVGGETIPILDFGQGPWEECGWCQGTGLVTRWIRGQWLCWKKKCLRVAEEK